MNYNLYINTVFSEYNILEINNEDLTKIIKSYNSGKTNVFIGGKKRTLERLNEIQIYTFDHKDINTKKQLLKICKDNELFGRGFFGNEWVPNSVLEKYGARVTEDYIKGDYGYLKNNQTHNSTIGFYVDANRINEIETIENLKYDLTKLVALLHELNSAHSKGLVLTIPLLTRAIIDHVPPLFGKDRFTEICGSCGNRSFKESMSNLHKSSRKIADSILHVMIRNKESLPNLTQVNFKNDLDVLLQEIVRMNKK